MKDNTVVLTSTITAMDHTNTSAVFRSDYRIDSVTTNDSGLYNCTVTNPLGSDSTTIAVINAGMCSYTQVLLYANCSMI